ncbi:MAG: hypothetical protein AMXMBFR61_04220 [Fimbriimonadales bacterium]
MHDTAEGDPLTLASRVPGVQHYAPLRAGAHPTLCLLAGRQCNSSTTMPGFSESGGRRTLYLLTGQQSTNTATVPEFPGTGMHVGARYYSPSLRRWLQRDPIDLLAGDPNLYVYCANYPVGLVDRTGLDGFEFTLEVVAEGLKTGLCAVGEAFTFGLWKNEQYANKPGYGTSVLLATGGREALLTAGAIGASKAVSAARAARSARAATATAAAASTSRAAPIVRGGIEVTKHAAERMASRGVTSKMVETALARGERFWDPVGKTYIYVLRKVYQTKGGAQDLLVARSSTCNKIVTVMVGNRVINPRYVSIR